MRAIRCSGLSTGNYGSLGYKLANENKKYKRPMGHIAHLSNLGPYRNIIYISFPFAPFDPQGPMILINLPLFYVRKLSCKIQLFWLHSS
jgi:hypothetical protein